MVCGLSSSRITPSSTHAWGGDAGAWEALVPVQNQSKPHAGDRPGGNDPRDQYVGHKRIDFPVVQVR